ncbi:MAG: hypothetical protein ACLTCB_07535 [Merdibacter sp.]
METGKRGDRYKCSDVIVGLVTRPLSALARRYFKGDSSYSGGGDRGPGRRNHRMVRIRPTIRIEGTPATVRAGGDELEAVDGWW